MGGKETYAKCEYQSVYGKVSSAWEIKGDKVHYTIEIPSNTTAEISIDEKLGLSAQADTNLKYKAVTKTQKG